MALRSLLLPFTLVALALPCVVAVEACSVSAATSSAFAAAGSDASDLQDPTYQVAKSGVDGAAAKELLGSPLCGVDQCSPDDDGRRPLASSVQGCAPDGGAPAPPEGDATVPLLPACRIVKNATQQSAASSSCTPLAADGRGVDGASCKSASECASGFDCVDGEKGAVCRRYCCAGSCEGYPAANGGPTFCDVQSVVRPTAAPTPDDQVKAPVCMPIKACTLLAPGGCGRKESCAVVTEKGVTGCVTNDERQAGKSCEDKHCAEGLTCLGSPGDRTCYKLCRTTTGADCGPTQTCTTGSTFQDTSFGVCKD